MRRILEAVALAAAMLMPTHAPAANTWGADFSDLWWNHNESGWGANLSHQREIVFMTLFVYGPDAKPKWYVASSMTSRGGEPSHAFDGTLYEATGPYLGTTPFNPSSVALRAVGVASLEFTAHHLGTLTYTVDGVSVSKAIERQTFRNNDLTGSYVGAQIGVKTNCGAANGNAEYSSQFVIDHPGPVITISADLGNNLFCTYTGDYVQYGKVGQIDGSFSCSNGSQGTFFAPDIEASDKGFTGRFFADFGNSCNESARIGGVKR
ncbi:MAG: hypothetical protein AB7O32_02470 [Vicinamibacterales bacterium]